MTIGMNGHALSTKYGRIARVLYLARACESGRSSVAGPGKASLGTSGQPPTATRHGLHCVHVCKMYAARICRGWKRDCVGAARAPVRRGPAV
eukprot:7191352-Prymnesium_polylepis.1